MIKSLKQIYLIAILLTIFDISLAHGGQELSIIEIAAIPEIEIGAVNRLILGNNIIGYRDGRISSEFNIYGGGVWNPIERQPNVDYLALLRKAGITMLRWPGGKWRKNMDWKTKLVGGKRQPFGLPEFLKLCEAIGAQPVITLSAEYTKDIDVNALVSYLNSPIESKDENANEGSWAHQRMEDGRKLPWNVTWFEYGNENFNSTLTVAEYINGYKEVREILKNISPAAKLGAVLEDSDNSDSGWSKTILSELVNQLDFGIIHPYIPMVVEGAIDAVGHDRTINSSLYADANLEYRLNKLQKVAADSGWLKPLRLAATEYNAHFVQNNPVPIRHTISTAVHNADFMRVMLHPEHNIIFANYWHATNGYWGMLQGFPHKKQSIYKRPNYYVYYIYNKFLLDTLVSFKLYSPEINFEGAFGVGPRLISKGDPVVSSNHQIPESSSWKQRIFLGGKQTEKNGILKVEFLGNKDVDYYHGYKIFKVRPNTLYRASVKARATNLTNGKVGIAVEDVKGWKKNYYQAKNLSINGTRKWQRLTVEFRTNLDTDKVKVITRKYKGEGATKGIAEFGKVMLEELDGELPSAKLLTGLVSLSKDKRKLSLILINKSLNGSINVNLKLPRKCELIEAETLTGQSPLSFKKKDIFFRSLEVKNGVALLPPQSVTGIMFSKCKRPTSN